MDKDICSSSSNYQGDPGDLGEIFASNREPELKPDSQIDGD